ncbi:MAG: phosphoenolpyruvate carboxykinase (GTP) [Nanoarchaeota archaeon]|nr:phosphoenolpyruvate carboxykinase (GTP) [Nanoarchaeota archaeon]
MAIDGKILDKQNLKKLEALKNPHVLQIVEKYIKICKPKKAIVFSDSKEDIAGIRKLSVEKGEEIALNTKGHTIHFDGISDLARATKDTKILLPKGKKLSRGINSMDREEGLKEVLGLMDGIMKGKDMLICFFCLGPINSEFSIPALQITDSTYVAHSESILYRSGYGEFKRLKGKNKFFHFVHSAGELDENNMTKNLSKRRIYMDLEDNRVFTINNQYAGNSVGLKKLALRLAINKANKEDWLSEHMFVMGVRPEGKKRVTYFTGAFPSACGKTSTAMIPGQTIIGDDIAYLRAGKDGRAYAVNVEQGMFGIIQDINPQDDPVIHDVLTTPREIIFSNVLLVDGVPYWLNMGKDLPKKGINFSGEWYEGKKDSDGNLIDPASKNARYTVRISELSNADPKADDPKGVPVSGFIYGGRDSDTTVPVFESLSWSHGVYVGSVVESETTAAIIGQAGVRRHDPMANIDFMVVPLGTYIKNHLAFGERLDKPPRIFHTNYFLKNNGKFLNTKLDKKVWLMWMEGRAHNEFGAIETPVGLIPKYEDLKALFRQIFKRDYTKEEYVQQFSIRTDKLIDKLRRVRRIYSHEEQLPPLFLQHMLQEERRLRETKEKYNKEVISPFEFRD